MSQLYSLLKPSERICKLWFRAIQIKFDLIWCDLFIICSSQCAETFITLHLLSKQRKKILILHYQVTNHVVINIPSDLFIVYSVKWSETKHENSMVKLWQQRDDRKWGRERWEMTSSNSSQPDAKLSSSLFWSAGHRDTASSAFLFFFWFSRAVLTWSLFFLCQDQGGIWCNSYISTGKLIIWVDIWVHFIKILKKTQTVFTQNSLGA